MLKKLSLILFVVFFFSVLVAAYLYFKKATTPPGKAINAIPSSASLIIECENFTKIWKKLSKETKYWAAVHSIQTIKKLDSAIVFVNSLIHSNNEFEGWVKTQPLFISAHKTGVDNFGFLFAMSIHREAGIIAAKELIKKAAGNRKISERKYEEVLIYEISIDDKAREKFFYAIQEGILFCSFSSLLVEDAVRQIHSGRSVTDNADFHKVMRTAADKADANIYINYETMPSLLNVFLNNQNKTHLQQMPSIANWTEIDLVIKPEALALNGLTWSNDSANNYLNTFHGQKPQKIKITDVLPDNSMFFISVNAADFGKFYKEYTDFLGATRKLFDHERKVEKINADYDTDIESNILSWMGNEMAMVLTGSKTSDNKNPLKYVVIHCNDTAEAYKMLDKLSKAAELNSKEHIDVFEKNYMDYMLNYNGMPDIISAMFGNLMGKNQGKFWSIVDQYVVFADNLQSLKIFINNYLQDNTLARNIHYNEYSENLLSKTGVFIYANLPILIESGFLKTMLGNNSSAALVSNKEPLKQFEAFSIQLSPSSKGLFFTNGYLNYNPAYREKTQSLWQAHLDTSVSKSPWILQNHTTKEKEIFVQDDANSVYLITNAGKILWKKQLNEEIISSIFQIDIYKNGKLQMMFNTRNHIYLIDRKGQDVEQYPIKTGAKATNGILVLDYDNNKNYRILLACQNKMVYNFDKFGQIIKGWEFEKTNEPVEADIKYFSINKKDYIIIVDKGGNIQVVDRKGKERIKIKQQFAYLADNRYYIDLTEKISTARIVTSDSTGKIYSITFEDKKDSIYFDAVVSPDFFMLAEVNGDKTADYIFLENERIYVFNGKDKELLWDYEFDGSIGYPPAIFINKDGKTNVGVVSAQTNELYLFEPDGKITKGFPIYGKTPFQITYLNAAKTKNLITGTGDRAVYIYTID